MSSGALISPKKKKREVSDCTLCATKLYFCLLQSAKQSCRDLTSGVKSRLWARARTFPHLGLIFQMWKMRHFGRAGVRESWLPLYESCSGGCVRKLVVLNVIQVSGRSARNKWGAAWGWWGGDLSHKQGIVSTIAWVWLRRKKACLFRGLFFNHDKPGAYCRSHCSENRKHTNALWNTSSSHMSFLFFY